MANRDELVLNLRGRITDLEKQLKKAGQLGEDTASGIEDRFSRINPVVKGLAGGLVAGLGVGKLIQALGEANAELVKMGDLARLTGQSVEDLSRLQGAGRLQGISSEDMQKGLRAVAEKLNEARREENELTKLLDANNIKWKDREGNVIGVNKALEVAAQLIQNAATELDKVEIAKRFGLPESFIKLLGDGVDKFREIQKAAEDAGLVISRETIESADKFQKAWEGAWRVFGTESKAVLYDVIKGIDFLITKAGDAIAEWRRMQTEPITAGRGGMVWREDPNNPEGGPPPNTPVQIYNTPIGPTAPPWSPPRTGTRTVIPTSGRSGGGGEETTDADRAQARLEKYIESLMRQEAVEKAIAETIGQSRAAQQAAIEIAKAQVDLSKLDEETRKRITEQLTTQVKKLEEQRAATERLRRNQQAYNDLLRTAGGMAVDTLDRMIAGGASLGEVMADITRQLGRMFLQAALLGQGPLGQLLGLAGTNGGVGGIFGAIFGGFRAEGGSVRAGRSYVVGEDGPELVHFGRSGTVVPNDVAFGSRAGQPAFSFGDTYIDARNSNLSEAQFRKILAEERSATLEMVPARVRQAQINREL